MEGLYGRFSEERTHYDLYWHKCVRKKNKAERYGETSEKQANCYYNVRNVSVKHCGDNLAGPLIDHLYRRESEDRLLWRHCP